MGSQYTSKQLLPLSAEKPYVLTAEHLQNRQTDPCRPAADIESKENVESPRSRL